MKDTKPAREGDVLGISDSNPSVVIPHPPSPRRSPARDRSSYTGLRHRRCQAGTGRDRHGHGGRLAKARASVGIEPSEEFGTGEDGAARTTASRDRRARVVSPAAPSEMASVATPFPLLQLR